MNDSKKIMIGLLTIMALPVFCQTKTITGKIINEDFEVLNGATIQTLDSIYTTQSDDKGKFRLEVPMNCKRIQVWLIGMEPEKVKLKSRCYVNIVLVNDVVVEFETIDEPKQDYLNRRRRADSEVFKKAYEQGIFTE